MTGGLPAPTRRRRLLLLALAAAGTAGLGSVLAQGGAGPRVIAITARRFRFEPAEIMLKVGEPVLLEMSSLDFIHGMNIPDLAQRYDLQPGRVTRIALTPSQPGVIDFVCDNFCGDGHEEMHGRLVVQA